MRADILVTGGAGFIGSYVDLCLRREGFSTIVVDDLSRGVRFSNDNFFLGDVGNPDLLDRIFQNHSIAAVIHLAGSISVGESFAIPAHYYKNNVANTITLLGKMLEYGVRKIVFSSSAGVYGLAQQEKINEDHPLNPINPYGRTKMMVDRILDDYHASYGLNSISLRYFNAAGGDPAGILPHHSRLEVNLIPIIMRGLLSPSFHLNIFGSDYPTRDGTCVRDYIHLDDLAKAHILSLKSLLEGEKRRVYNLGNGDGYSNLEVVRMIETVSGRKVNYSMAERRCGDPPILVADCSRAERDLGWQRRYSELKKIVEDAWKGIQGNITL